MKAKKTNNFQEEAEKIEQIPEDKNDGRDGQDDPIKAKTPRKKRFLARLRKIWAGITGCMRCCTYTQEERSAEELSPPNGIIMEEEFPSPSGTNMEELTGRSGVKVEEEHPAPCDSNMEDSKDMSFTVMLPEGKEENVEENQNIKPDNEEAEVVVIDSLVEKEIEAENQRLLDLIHSQEDLYVHYYASQQEILAKYDPIHDLIQIIEDLHTLHYDAEGAEQQESEVGADAEGEEQQDGEQQESKVGADAEGEEQQEREQLESKVGADAEGEEQRDGEQQESKVRKYAEGKIKEVGENGLENSESTKESQRASCEMPGCSHISNTDNESSKENEGNKGEEKSININEKREECSSKQKSSSKSSSLEDTTPEELYKSIKTSQSSSSDYNSTFCSLEEETPEELYKSTNTTQGGSSHHDEEPSRSDSSEKPEPPGEKSDICLEKLEQPGEETPARVPLTLQSFRFHRELGNGSFGDVYLASDNIRKECVAIKVTNKDVFTEYGYSFAERHILELSHESPFLIHGLAAFHTETVVYFVMEWASRGDLFDFMRKNHPLDHRTIQFIIAEVICGIQFLHNRGIIHRDLKPGNILLSADGHLKIADFGHALMDVYDRTKKKAMGTPAYMAPELVRKEEHGRGVDYYAIGVILYKMYTSQLPFYGQNASSLKYCILNNTPLYPEFLTPDTVDILEGLLCKDQDHRLGVIGDIKQHTFFSDINWEDVEARRVEPPAIMTAASVNLNTKQTLRYMESINYIRPEDQKMFKNFSFVCPDWSQHYHPVNNEAI